MWRLYVIIRIVLKWNCIVNIFVKELPKVTKYNNRVKLVGMYGYVEDTFGSMNSICDDNNMCNVLYLRCSTNTTSNSKQFSFYSQYIHFMINSICNNFILSLCMWDWNSDIIFDTCIRYNEYSILVIRWLLIDVIEFVLTSNFSISVFSIN